MGWKGTVRSIRAAVREAERDSKRRQRELNNQQKQYEKMQEMEQAAHEVDVFENYIDIIQSVHKECSPIIDWKDIVEAKEPLKPENLNRHEQKIRLEAENYVPGFWDKVLKKEEKKKKELEYELGKAIKKDSNKYKSALVEWENELKDWRESVELAQSILNGDNRAKIDAIEKINPFSEISNLGSSLIFSVEENDVVEATLHVHGEDIVPTEVKSLLKSGKLSIKKMPKGKFNEIYQDYVCSCALRVANELFSIIPDSIVIITAVDELLNTKAGHLEKSPILSVCVSRKTIHTLNMDAIDPSDSMDNFVHNMSFKKTKGFEAVARIEPKILENV